MSNEPSLYDILFFDAQIWRQLPRNAARIFSFEEKQEMHEIRKHVDASFRPSAEGLSSVMWHDIVQVNAPKKS